MRMWFRLCSRRARVTTRCPQTSPAQREAFLKIRPGPGGPCIRTWRHVEISNSSPSRQTSGRTTEDYPDSNGGPGITRCGSRLMRANGDSLSPADRLPVLLCSGNLLSFPDTSFLRTIVAVNFGVQPARRNRLSRAAGRQRGQRGLKV